MPGSRGLPGCTGLPWMAAEDTSLGRWLASAGPLHRHQRSIRTVARSTVLPCLGLQGFYPQFKARVTVCIFEKV